MSGAGVLLEVQQLSKRFGGVVASAGIDLQVRAGEIHALIGPNGAGKTTLVAQLAGQLSPDRGRIVFAGEDITRLSPHERARRGLARIRMRFHPSILGGSTTGGLPPNFGFAIVPP